MPKSFHIREAAEPDWEPALALQSTVFVGEGFVSSDRHRQNGRRELIEPAGTLIVAVDDRSPHLSSENTVLGAVVLASQGGPLSRHTLPGEAEFRMLAVAPSARGRGVGEALVRECLDRARRPPHSARAMVIWTQPEMLAAQALYARMGFVRVPARDISLGPEVEGTRGMSTRERWALCRELGSGA